MRNYSISKSIYRLALLAILFLVGCDIPAQPIPTESLPASTMIPPAKTQAAPATIPDIRVPDTPTPTPVPPATSTSILTPLPTLDPQATEQEITRGEGQSRARLSLLSALSTVIRGARVAPQQLPYPPANTLILPESLLGREAGLPLSLPPPPSTSTSLPSGRGCEALISRLES